MEEQRMRLEWDQAMEDLLDQRKLKKHKNRKILILEMMKGCDNFPDHKEITLFDYLDGGGNLQA